LEKCGTGLELFNDLRREQMRSDIAMLRRLKAGWDAVWDAGGYRPGDIPASTGGKNVLFSQWLSSLHQISDVTVNSMTYRHYLPDLGKVPIRSLARHWCIAYFYGYAKNRYRVGEEALWRYT